MAGVVSPTWYFVGVLESVSKGGVYQKRRSGSRRRGFDNFTLDALLFALPDWVLREKAVVRGSLVLTKKSSFFYYHRTFT